VQARRESGARATPSRRVVDGYLGLEEVTHCEEERGHELRQKDRPDQLIEPPWSHPLQRDHFGHTLEHLALRQVCGLTISPQLVLDHRYDHLVIDEADHEIANTPTAP